MYVCGIVQVCWDRCGLGPEGLVYGGVFEVLGVAGDVVVLLGVVGGLSNRDDGTGAGSAQRDVSDVDGVVCGE